MEVLFDDGMYIEGTNRLKPEIFGIFVTLGFIIVVFLIIFLCWLAEYGVSYLRWRWRMRRQRRRVRNIIHATDVSSAPDHADADEGYSHLENLSTSTSLDLNSNNNNSNTEVQNAETSVVAEILPKRVQGSHSFAKLAESTSCIRTNFYKARNPSDPNNNPIYQVSHVEIEDGIQVDKQRLDPGIIDVIIVKSVNPNTDPKSDRESLNTTMSKASVQNELATKLSLKRQLIPEIDRKPGPSFFQELRDRSTQNLLEYSQSEGGWNRNKIENYIPARTHPVNLPKTNFLGSGYLGSILEPVNNFVTSLVTPDPSVTVIEIEDVPARYDEREYDENDVFRIEGRIDDLTRPRDVGVVSMLNFMQAEGSPHFQSTNPNPNPLIPPIAHSIQWSDRITRTPSVASHQDEDVDDDPKIPKPSVGNTASELKSSIPEIEIGESRNSKPDQMSLINSGTNSNTGSSLITPFSGSPDANSTTGIQELPLLETTGRKKSDPDTKKSTPQPIVPPPPVSMNKPKQCCSIL